MQAQVPFDEDSVRALSSSLDEPTWLTNLRLKAFRSFASLPKETNPLYTKYVRVSEFDYAGLGVPQGGRDVDLREFFGGFLGGNERNIAVQGNQRVVHIDLDKESVDSGVLFVPVGQALKDHEAFVRRIFETDLVKVGADSQSAFVGAFFNGGTLVHVPDGVELGTPLRRLAVTGGQIGPIVERNIVSVGRDAKLTLLEEMYSKEADAPGLHSSVLEVHASRGAKVDLSSIQALGRGVVRTSNTVAGISDDSSVTLSSLSTGSRVSRSRMNYLLNGRGAVAEGFELFFTDGNQRYDFESNLVHNSPDTEGSIHARGVVKGSSQSIFKGMIKIVGAAKNSRSYLAHHALILERTAKSDAIPGLEIDNNEVKATHSASVAQMDDEQLFYLMARGLDSDAARKMVVMGFFEPVLSRVPVERTREGARYMLEGKWEGRTGRLLEAESSEDRAPEASSSTAKEEGIFERHYKYR